MGAAVVGAAVVGDAVAVQVVPVVQTPLQQLRPVAHRPLCIWEKSQIKITMMS